MPGLVGVGLTSSLLRTVRRTCTPQALRKHSTLRSTTTSRPRAVERRAHDLLGNRTNPKREFFRVSVGKAIETVRRALVDAGGMDRGICSDVGRQGEVLDLWQAHVGYSMQGTVRREPNDHATATSGVSGFCTATTGMIRSIYRPSWKRWPRSGIPCWTTRTWGKGDPARCGVWRWPHCLGGLGAGAHQLSDLRVRHFFHPLAARCTR